LGLQKLGRLPVTQEVASSSLVGPAIPSNHFAEKEKICCAARPSRGCLWVCANGPECSKTRYNFRYSRERNFTAREQAKTGAHRGWRDAVVYPTSEDLLAVLKAGKARSARDWVMVLLAYRHGLRASEVCDLKVPDMDPKAGSFLILAERLASQRTALYQHRGATSARPNGCTACLTAEARRTISRC